MTILAIDPGPVKSAYVAWDAENQKIDSKGIVPNEILLSTIKIGAGLEGMKPAIEMIASYGMPVGAEVFETCVWIGQFKEAWENRFGLGHEVRLIRRMEAKTHLCHDVKAKDSNIRQAIIDRLGGKDIAIGNDKCKACHGKGWVGRGRPACATCNGSGWKNIPGPLATVCEDEWAALAVAVTCDDLYK